MKEEEKKFTILEQIVIVIGLILASIFMKDN